MTELELRFSHNVIEHLGLKLYQNRPTRVIAEVVSNAWDAEAEVVDIQLHQSNGERSVAVHDNGHGMSRHSLQHSFLVVGVGRRHAPDDRTANKARHLMGRKGIGKLAPFGIAQTVDVITASREEGPSLHWLRFNLADILKGHSNGPQLDSNPAPFQSYRPTIVYQGDDIDELCAAARDEDKPHCEAFLRTAGGTDPRHPVGTSVIMRDLSLQKSVSESRLISSLGRRFTVTLGDDFDVYVNNVHVTQQVALPDFEFRIPEHGHQTEKLGNKEVRYWVGFVESADWPQDQAGIGVYAHGKIAQDRPFTFSLKGREIFTRYMFGVVEADWLDEQTEDVISTDRTSVNWDSAIAQPLFQWGTAMTRRSIDAYMKWRRARDKEANARTVQELHDTRTGAMVTSAEREQIVDIVSEITPSLHKREDQKVKLIRAVSDAWVQRPMRSLVTSLWESLGRNETISAEAFTAIVQRLQSFSVPESLNLAAIFAQRAFALNVLNDYVHHGKEVDLQRLIEVFPWVVEPDLAVLSANQSLRRAVDKAETLGQIPIGRRVEVAGVHDGMKPDFVFLSTPSEMKIVVIELKNPQVELTIDNRQQLIDYMNWFEKHYTKAELSGRLIGSGDVQIHDNRVDLIPWTAVLERSKARNLELLSAMLLQTGDEALGDTRSHASLELGGEELRSALAKFSEQNPTLKRLFEEFEEIKAAHEASI